MRVRTLRSYLVDTQRLKHNLEVNPVRREGKIIGKRLEAAVIPNGGNVPSPRPYSPGTRAQSGALFGKRRFEALVADALLRAGSWQPTDARGVAGQRERPAAGLISEALPV